MKYLFFLFLFIFSNLSWAKTVCVCDIAEDKRDHWLWVGCKAKQVLNKCDIQTSVKHGDFDQLVLELRDKIQDGDTLRITYLGHWGSYRTLGYIHDFLVPLARLNKIDILYENTGCSPMEYSRDVQTYLNSLNLNGSSISVIGNQSTSVGAASLLISGGRDLYGYASSKWNRHRYTECSFIEGQRCSQHQLGASGVCYDSKKNKINEISCNPERLPIGLYQTFWVYGPVKYPKVKSNR